ncbi:Adhesin OS=Streptomyces aurantiogriseus OX=66870 GN=GCM10010251_17850 PE=4 SV=1 [Streptomyces aurantiogriseus]
MMQSFVADARPGAVDVPELTRTVPRQLVHRAAVAEVFLTGWSALDEGRTRVLAQWPRAHSFYTPVDGRHDPLLVAETIRQAGVLVAHAVHDVPLGHRFLMWGLHFTVRPDHLAVGTRPADLELDVDFSEVRGPKGRLEGPYTVTIRLEDRVVATGGARFTCTSPAVYRRLRGARLEQSAQGGGAAATPPQPLPPASVGRQSAFDVVLAGSESTRRWQLRVDTAHPILFDHPDDHIPGMVLLEAARQAATALSPEGSVLVAMENGFDRYVEFGSPCWIEAEELPADDPAGRPGGVRVVGRQDGEQVFSSLLTLDRPTA